MAKHSPRFLKLVEDMKPSIRELSIDDVKAKLDRGEKFHLVDVREESEWAAGHLPKAEYLGRGIIERDIETKIPNVNDEIILYCGGGFRSALAAGNLQKMGYQNVYSMDGGYRGWNEKGLPIEKPK
jgi:rhodanese-related sulfurtransferase